MSSALDVIVHVSRLMDGTRKIMSFQEITGMEGNIITTQEIFSFQQTGIDDDRRVKGVFQMTGLVPRFVERFKALGIPIPYEIFDATRVLTI